MKPEVSLGVGLATAAIVGAVYVNATPSLVDSRVAKPNDPDLEAARKTAAWTSAGVVAGISLLSKDATVFILGGAMVITLDWWYRHANQVDPNTGKASTSAAMAAMAVPTQQSDPGQYGYAGDMAGVSLGF